MTSPVEWGAAGGKNKNGMLGAQSLYVLEREVKGNLLAPGFCPHRIDLLT